MTMLQDLAAWAQPKADKFRRYRFKGEVYFLVGDSLDVGGPLATREQYETWEISYAYLFPDGVIRRYNVPIGTRADLEEVAGEASKASAEGPQK